MVIAKSCVLFIRYITTVCVTVGSCMCTLYWYITTVTVTLRTCVLFIRYITIVTVTVRSCVFFIRYITTVCVFVRSCVLFIKYITSVHMTVAVKSCVLFIISISQLYVWLLGHVFSLLGTSQLWLFTLTINYIKVSFSMWLHPPVRQLLAHTVVPVMSNIGAAPVISTLCGHPVYSRYHL